MPGKIFVSYRRDDSRDAAARVRDWLAQAFGASNVFMDVDNLYAGQRFDQELQKALNECDVFLAIMGPRWLDEFQRRQQSGQRDFVREEIAAALARGKLVAPVLLERAVLPTKDQLPPDIADLVMHQTHTITHETFGRDVQGLIDGIMAARGVSVSRAAKPWRAMGVVAAGLLAAGIVAFGVLQWRARNPQNLPQQAAAVAIKDTPSNVAAGTETMAAGANAAGAGQATASEQIADAAAAAEKQRLAMLAKEEADRKVQAAAEAVRPGRVFRDCETVCPEMVVVPAGTFMMGSPATEEGRDDDEGPQHKETIGRALAIGKVEVTLAQFAAFVAETDYKTDKVCHQWTGSEWKQNAGSYTSPGFAQTGAHPAVCVSWDDAKAYAGWLSNKTGKPYRLLSEAEWEYAVRGVTVPALQSRYHFGNDAKQLCAYANVADQSALPAFSNWPAAPCKDGVVASAPGGSFRPNKFGLYDMHGNVWEWVEDCYGPYAATPGDGSPRLSGECQARVVRSGSWGNDARYLRSADRFRYPAANRMSALGFRVGRTLDP